MGKFDNILLMPRLIRLRDAPGYLGMDRNRFNVEVRPIITEIPIGVQGKAFDRKELDKWADQHIAKHGYKKGEISQWLEKERQALLNEATPGTSTNLSLESKLESLLKRAASKKPKRT